MGIAAILTAGNPRLPVGSREPGIGLWPIAIRLESVTGCWTVQPLLTHRVLLRLRYFVTLQLFADPENEAVTTSEDLVHALDSEDWLCQPMQCVSESPSGKLGPCCLVACTSLTIILISAALGLVPQWAQASCLGTVWGCVLLTGLGCCWAKHRMLMALVSIAIAFMAACALNALTDLPALEIRIGILALLGCGWIIGIAWTPWLGMQRQPWLLCHSQSPVMAVDWCKSAKLETGHVQRGRCSLWDLAGLTSGFALLCWWIPQWQHPSALICHVAPAVIGGCLLSWLAVECAWRDHWTLTRLVCGAGLILTAFGLSLVGPPAGWDWGSAVPWAAPAVPWGEADQWTRIVETLQRALRGPLSVMTAQGLCVLGFLAAWRIDRSMVIQASAGRSRREEYRDRPVASDAG